METLFEMPVIPISISTITTPFTMFCEANRKAMIGQFVANQLLMVMGDNY